MALRIAFGAAVALMALLGGVGFRRDPRRGVMALAGTLLGAILAGFWAAPWGESLASRFVGGNAPRMTFILSCLLFLFCALVVGYGGGLLLGPRERMPIGRRVAGALLGVLNGALIAAYLVRFGAAGDPAFREEVQDWLPARVLHDGLPLLFLGVTAGVALLVFLRASVLVAARRRAARAALAAAAPPTAAPTTAPPAPGETVASPRQAESDVLNKANDAVP